MYIKTKIQYIFSLYQSKIPKVAQNLIDINQPRYRFLRFRRSGSFKIDNFIEFSCANAVSADKGIDWIDPEKILNIQRLTNGGYSTIYTGILSDGSDSHQTGTRVVALKSLGTENNINEDTLKEVGN